MADVGMDQAPRSASADGRLDALAAACATLAEQVAALRAERQRDLEALKRDLIDGIRTRRYPV